MGNENYRRPRMHQHAGITLDKMRLANNEEQGRNEIVHNALLTVNRYFDRNERKWRIDNQDNQIKSVLRCRISFTFANDER